jgi:hypothetical protein
LASWSRGTWLRGWEGLIGDDEKAIAFSPKRPSNLLSDPAYAALENQVIRGINVGEVDAEFTEAAAKN